MSGLVVVTIEDDRHDPGSRHPESPERVQAAYAGIVGGAPAGALVPLTSRPATVAEITKVHDPDYVAALEHLCAEGGGRLDTDTPVSRGSWPTALEAAGAGLAAVEALESGVADAAFALTRPPGHHALAERGMGFCLFNNIAITATQLADRGERVLVLDWDVHHGNGTQAIFWNDPRVLYVSLHQDNWYPGTGHPEEIGGPGALGTTLNLPLPAGATGDVMAGAIDTVIAPAVDRFTPTWILVSAGFDAHRNDPLAELALSAGDFAVLAAASRGFAPAPGRLILFLEGGYDLAALAASTAAVTAMLLDEPCSPERPTAGGPGRAEVAQAKLLHDRTLEDALSG